MVKSLYDTPPKDFCLMIIGNAGSGKSTLSARFPKPFFLSLDKNLRGPAAVMHKENKRDILFEDTFDKDDAGLEVPPGMRFNRFAAVLTAAIKNDNVETIVVDNVTLLSDLIIDDLLRQTQKKAMEIQTWGLYLGAWKLLVAKLRQCGKNVIIIAHERVEKDEIDGTLRYYLAVPGQTADILPTLVTDVWRCEVEEKLVGNQRVHIRNVRVVQSNRFPHLKTSNPDLPAVFEATTDAVTKIMAGVKL